MSLLNNEVQCNDGGYDIRNGAVAPCFNRGGIAPKSKFDFSGISELLNKGGFPTNPIQNGENFSKQREIERQQNLALEQAKLDAVMLKNPNYNSLTDKVFGKQEGWSFTRLFTLGGYTILGVILGRYVAKNMGKSTNLGMVIGGVLPYVAYKLSLEYDKKQFSKQPQQAPKQPVDVSNLTNINKGGNAMPLQISDWEILSKIPSEFIVKSNGFNTRYYKSSTDKNLTGFSALLSVPDVYKQSGTTDGSDGGSSPIKITIREFSDAYNQFLKQPK